MSKSSSNYTPRSERSKDYITLLNSQYKTSMKNSIQYKKDLELLQKKMKIWKAEEHKIEYKQNLTEILKHKEDEIRQKNKIKKLLAEDFKKKKQKEIESKRHKVRNLRENENKKAIEKLRHSKANSENLANEIRVRRQKLSEDIIKEKKRISEEKRIKRNNLQMVDDYIQKRKKEIEKRKQMIYIEQMEKEIKLQEDYNNKLKGKILKYRRVGINRIIKFINIH